MKVRILGFDPGTANLGYACIEGDLKTKRAALLPYYGVLTTSKRDGDIRKRVDALSVMLESKVTDIKPNYIIIEDYTEQGVKSGVTYKEMSILIENMRITCHGLGYFEEVNELDILTNAEWKKLATGSSGLNKYQVQHFVKHKIAGTETLGSRKSDTHVWDAAGIAYAKFTKLLRGEL